jgi:hypothetical protein
MAFCLENPLSTNSLHFAEFSSNFSPKISWGFIYYLVLSTKQSGVDGWFIYLIFLNKEVLVAPFSL